MVWVRSPVYFYKRKNTYYFSKAVPSDLQHRFNKRKIEVSLRTKSETKAAKSAAALSDRLQRHWDTLRMEMIYSRELGLVVKGGNHEPRHSTLTLTDALSLYQLLKGTNKTKLFFEASDRSRTEFCMQVFIICKMFCFTGIFSCYCENNSLLNFQSIRTLALGERSKQVLILHLHLYWRFFFRGSFFSLTNGEPNRPSDKEYVYYDKRGRNGAV